MPSLGRPTGSYGATLDANDRQLSVNDPADATDFSFAYRADGQVDLIGRPDGNWTDFEYDALGRMTSSDTEPWE